MPSETGPKFDFSTTPLSPEDQNFADAYESLGRPLDDLVYTDEFDQLLEMLGRPRTNEMRRYLYKRLLALKQRGILPRFYRG